MKNEGRINAENADLARLLWVCPACVRTFAEDPLEDPNFAVFPEPHGV
jgi:hypothetical protein